ncbi:MAG: hypothetical protein EBR40_09445, partial [Proteobacteria bacterium]|nr:hypothetical protein [Pseudomonadota bacterium]
MSSVLENLESVREKIAAAADRVGRSSSEIELVAVSKTHPTEIIREAVEAALDMLDRGEARVAEPGADGWVVNQWLKQAVLLSFRLTDSAPMDTAAGAFDKVPLKWTGWGENRWKEAGFRAVPGAVVRRSAFIAPNV